MSANGFSISAYGFLNCICLYTAFCFSSFSACSFWNFKFSIAIFSVKSIFSSAISLALLAAIIIAVVTAPIL